MIEFDCHGVTHPGKKRPTNQDQFLVAELKKSMEARFTSLSEDDLKKQVDDGESGWMLMVADGMGGHAAGDFASRLVVETSMLAMRSLIPWYPHEDAADGRTLQEEAPEVLEQCRARLARSEMRHPERAGMGTTLTVAYLVWPRGFLMHIGDSRCYALREGTLTQLTKDHTFAQQFVDEGALSPEQARNSAWAHTLWNVVSAHLEAPEPDYDRLDLRKYDALLLCSDGLTNHVDDAAIGEIVNSSATSKIACERLLEASLAGGGSDNITVAMARFVRHDSALSDTGERELSESGEIDALSTSDTAPLE